MHYPSLASDYPIRPLRRCPGGVRTKTAHGHPRLPLHSSVVGRPKDRRPTPGAKEVARFGRPCVRTTNDRRGCRRRVRNATQRDLERACHSRSRQPSRPKQRTRSTCRAGGPDPEPRTNRVWGRLRPRSRPREGVPYQLNRKSTQTSSLSNGNRIFTQPTVTVFLLLLRSVAGGDTTSDFSIALITSPWVTRVAGQVGQ